MKKAISILAWLLFVAGGVFIWRGGSDYWESVSSQKDEALRWENQNVEAESADASPIPKSMQVNYPAINPAKKGESIAKLSIPRLSAVLYVLEGTDDKDLKRGPGHLEGSVMPGYIGNCVIAGHRDTHFRVLKEVTKGDKIVIQSRRGTYTYRVSGISVVDPTNTDSLQPTQQGVLNLVTCFPFDFVGAAPRRYVVRADLIQS